MKQEYEDVTELLQKLIVRKRTPKQLFEIDDSEIGLHKWVFK